MNLVLFDLSKTETGAKTAPRVTAAGWVPGETRNVGGRCGLSFVKDVSFYMKNLAFKNILNILNIFFIKLKFSKHL